MYKEETGWYSPILGKQMNIRVYGHEGKVFLGIPTQDSMCNNFEDFGMIDTLSEYLEQGRMRLFVIDTVDKESWSDTYGDKGWRSARQEQYYNYVIEEVLPFIRERCGDVRPVTTGFSMGANHAANFFLRRPDLFDGVLALSGVYDSAVFFGDWMDSTLYDNTPTSFLANMSENHPYIDLYNQRQMIFCVGQGAWEEDGIRTLHTLDVLFREKGIMAWCDFWGYDVNHDWPWWKKQMLYFLPNFY